MPALHVICPLEKYFPNLENWINEAWAKLNCEGVLQDWSVRILRADQNSTFRPLDMYSVIKETAGPVLILGGISQAAISVLNTKLFFVCVSHHVSAPQHVDQISDAIRELLRRHDDGEPHIPIRFAAAIQILRKLQKHKYWGGEAMNKAFIWADDLPKGRGVTAATSGTTMLVAAELASRGLLKSKRSNGKLKFALNRDALPTMNSLFDCDWERVNNALQKWLFNDSSTVPVSEVQVALQEWSVERNNGTIFDDE